MSVTLVRSPKRGHVEAASTQVFRFFDPSMRQEQARRLTGV